LSLGSGGSADLTSADVATWAAGLFSSPLAGIEGFSLSLSLDDFISTASSVSPVVSGGAFVAVPQKGTEASWLDCGVPSSVSKALAFKLVIAVEFDCTEGASSTSP
jgi:hypothetical protein